MMARIDGKLIVKVTRWKIALARVAFQPIALWYAIGLISDSRVDRIASALAHWACKNAAVARVEWE